MVEILELTDVNYTSRIIINIRVKNRYNYYVSKL